MTTQKMLEKSANKITTNKRIYYDYVRLAHVTKVYNKGEVNGDIFTLTRLKDGHVICQFNIHTFEPIV